VAAVFEELSESMATPRKRIGSTAAAKILYLVKPKALPPALLANQGVHHQTICELFAVNRHTVRKTLAVYTKDSSIIKLYNLLVTFG